MSGFVRPGTGARGAGRAQTGDALRAAVVGLTAAIDEGSGYLPDDDVIAVEKVLRRASERLTLTGRHTVVALAGATGSGKSSLFNALVGQEVARSGHLRPTTSRVGAAVWGGDGDTASELLDWLRVRDRHHVAPGAGPVGAAVAPGAAEGLVLLDLPDIDSTRAAHRAEADRMLELTDVFVWVTDPQKYADARLHDDYLARASHHAQVSFVVLNQVDRLTPAETERCVADLRRLLAADGLAQVQVRACSARTGAGVPELYAQLVDAVGAAEAARLRLLGDVRAGAARLRRQVADTEPRIGDEATVDVIDALCDSAGVPTVLASVAADHRRRALASTGWPFTRWVRGLRPDPLKRLRLDAARDRRHEVTPFPAELERIVERSSLPQATPAARAAVDLVTRRLGATAAAGLPRPWADAVERAAAPDTAALADALDQAVLGTSLHLRRPLWWSVVGALQLLLAVAAVVGLGWLMALAGLAWLQLPAPPTPSVGVLPVPTLLLVGGLLGGVGLAAVSRVVAARGARRRVHTISLRLRDRIGQVARTQLVEPVQAVLARHRATREQLDAALEA